jgi:hypothetical protein
MQRLGRGRVALRRFKVSTLRAEFGLSRNKAAEAPAVHRWAGLSFHLCCNPTYFGMVQPVPSLLVARELAIRLISSEAAGRAESPATPDAAAAATDRLYRGLSRWIGRDGCHALFTRALAETRMSHPLLEEIELRPGSDRYLDATAPAIMLHGSAAANSALESMLVAVIELLARLIGDDMALKLIEQASADAHSSDPGSPNTRKKT